jgi:RsiW-degrading membrane proteinase PrsW (M82 family)
MMIKSLLFISIAPVIIVALYVYIRDKYEKEPVVNLLKALLTGVLIVLPVLLIEEILLQFGDQLDGLIKAFYTGFGVASLTEEGFKYVAFLLFFWSGRSFNEKFDGIVYAVFISLGFAAVENTFYVYEGGYQVGIVRALTAIPAHALFGTVMGYHFGKAKFYLKDRSKHLILAFLMPFTWHGLYDFFLMAGREIFLLLFIPLFIWFWINGFKKMKELSMASFFRNDFPVKEQHPDDKNDGG